ncbi:MAG: mechanosensitive ion channel [Gemmatimonadetes bacterium]|nr:mechanosensitive ion channel [Gemmatimonadota bacterium]
MRIAMVGLLAVGTLAGAVVPGLAASVAQPGLSLAEQDTARAGTSAPVVVRGDTVLIVPGRLGSFSAAERAAAIVDRVRRLSSTRVDSVQLVVAPTSTDLLAGEVILMTVTDADAAALGRPRAEISADFAARLYAEVRRVSKAQTIKTVALGVLYTLLASGVLVFLLVGLGRVFPRAYAYVETWRSRMPSIRIQTLELLSASMLTDALITAVRFVRIGIVIVLFYVYLPLVLSFFPWTQPLSNRLVGYVTTPLRQIGTGFLNYVPNIFFIGVIVLVTWYVLKAIRFVFGAVERGNVTIAGFDREWADPTYKIVQFLVMAFALVVLFPYLPGADSDAFKGISLFVGVLFSLGSSSAIANVVAGVVLTYTRAFNIGDRITVGETTGDVIAKSLLVTRVRTIKNVDVTVPNAMVLSSHIKNYSAAAGSDGLILHTTITIGYDVPWKRVHELLIAAAKATPGILATPVPFVLQSSLDDYYVSYQINAYTNKPAIMALTYGLLHAGIQDKFNEGGVEIMSPHYQSLRDGNQTAIPASYLSSEYAVPPFRVRHVEGDGRS